MKSLSELTIAEIKNQLNEQEPTIELINKLAKDKRIGVQKIATQLTRKKERFEALEQKWLKMAQLEKMFLEKGYHYIAGVDEAGRGPLAGPVIAAAVVLDPATKIIGLDDSKKLSSSKRDQLFIEIKEKALAVATGSVASQEIDEINIYHASLLAMERAINDLQVKTDLVLVDGNVEIPDLEIEQEIIIGGDSRVNAIAAASIIAKVTRDKIIEQYHQVYPAYNFLSNKGYGTAEHISALKRNGPTPIHRYSFNIVKESVS